MKLPVPFVQLPLNFDAAAMRSEIDALDASSWRQHPSNLPGNSMLPLIAAAGDPSDEGFVGGMLPTPELRHCPYLMQVLASLGATLGRTRLMRLAGRAEVARHVDQGYYWAERVRVHVPVVTQPTVLFECGDAAVNMAEGECWIFDTWRQHRVQNDSDEVRIHLVVDTVGGEEFWRHVSEGRTRSDEKQPWAPRTIMPGLAPTTLLMLESVNLPRVMSPWEMDSHFGLLFRDAVAHPRLKVVAQMTHQFRRAWHGLWARYGESDAGRSDYQAMLSRYVEAAMAAGEGILLTNGISWNSAMMTIIAKVAVDQGQVGLKNDRYGTSDRA